MKLKKTRLERTCSQCDKKINKGDMYGQKSKSYPVWQTYWSVDQRPKEEIPDWAWTKVYFSDLFDWCESCAQPEKEVA